MLTRSHSHRRKPTQTEGDSGLSTFLIDRSLANPALGTAFYWYLMIEVSARTSSSKMYGQVAFRFQQRLDETPEGKAQRDVLRRQGELVESLSARAKEIKASKDARSKRIDKLRAYIADPKHGLCPLSSPLPLPINAKVTVSSIMPEKSSVFKSNLFPLLLWFETTDDGSAAASAREAAAAAAGQGDDEVEHDAPQIILPDYPVIFKNGDDLRQDQLVIQLFTLMDRLLRKENLDLRLSPYNVLATSTAEGMIQFVPSKSLAAIMSEHGSLQNYLRIDHADDGALGTYGIEAGVLDTFIRSCGQSFRSVEITQVLIS